MKKKKLKLIEFLNMGSFPGLILLSVGHTYDELIKQLQKNYKTGNWEKDPSGLELWLFGIQGDERLLNNGKFFGLRRELTHPKFGTRYLYYIILQEFDFSDEHMVILAHECLHICQFHLPDILDRNKEHEAEAYLHTHIMRQCLEKMRKPKIK